MDMYRQQILDHYKHPRNFGHLARPDVVAEEGNVTCGDRIVMEITFQTQSLSNRNKVRSIKDIRFSGEGCAISQASASLITDKVKGMTVDGVRKLTGNDIIRLLGTTLTPSRVQCALLPLEVLQKAVADIEVHLLRSV